jgi:hypothetical protein
MGPDFFWGTPRGKTFAPPGGNPHTLPQLNSAVHNGRDYRQDNHDQSQPEKPVVVGAIGSF